MDYSSLLLLLYGIVNVCMRLSTSEAMQPPAYTISDVCERMLEPENTHTDINLAYVGTCALWFCARFRFADDTDFTLR